jgi:hypothetical protein
VQLPTVEQELEGEEQSQLRLRKGGVDLDGDDDDNCQLIRAAPLLPHDE